jgi:DHA1 family 2-module integral membrane pump EmrD-like MFS transporter
MSQTTASSVFTAVILLCVLMVAMMDLFIPSLPAMTHRLATSTDMTQLTITCYMLTYSLSHFVYGPISDRFGRRPVLLTGLGIGLVGSFICMMAANIEWLLLGRLLQGLGFGAGGLLTRAILRDSYTGSTLARYSSYCGIAVSVTLGLAPVLGGILQETFGWRSSFITIFLFMLVTSVYVFYRLPETIEQTDPRALHIPTLFRNYLTPLRSRIFWGYVICTSMAFSGIITYVATAPYLMIEILGLSPIEFGALAIFIAVAQTFSFTVNARFIEQLGIHTAIQIGFALMLSSSLLLLAISISGWLTVWTIMIPVTIYVIGTGFVYANTFAGAFTPFPNSIGVVSALYGGLQFIGAALVSLLIAIIPIISAGIIGIGFLLMTSIAITTFYTLLYKKDIHYGAQVSDE